MTDVLFLLLATLILGGGAAVWFTLQLSAEDRLIGGVFAGAAVVLLCVVVTIAGFRADESRRTRDRVRELESELTWLADTALPAAVAQLRAGASVDTVLSSLPRSMDSLRQRMIRLVTTEIGVGERHRAAALAACASAASRVQAMATSMLADLRDMESRFPEEYLGDLLRLDHSTAQTGRLADSIAVLTGARSGRRWTKPIVMESILRGAMGRISAYQRVRVHSVSTVAIVGYAAEDVMHALAELLDNATRFSAPSEEVHVYVEELHSGVVINVEDGGLGMKPQALARAEAAVSTAEQLDLAKLSGTRLGLAVVGTLARKHQLHVFFRPSSRGGTGVVVRIPNQLVIQPRWDGSPTAQIEPALPAAPVPAPAAESVEPAAAPTMTAVLDGSQPAGLPQRRRGQTLAAVRQASEPAEPLPPRPRADLGERFTAFHQSGSRPARPADDSTPPSTEPAAREEDDIR
ncbi:MAG TPA: ATP-binding protein [Actinophytocola sp.]|nr:ATP-binding protein [Actinophytocola sp.]HEU5471089.1 ATP-binding protein [Actinophytocola sp.]